MLMNIKMLKSNLLLDKGNRVSLHSSQINPLVPSAPFLCPQKTSENCNALCFQGVEKECVGSKWVKKYNRKFEWNEFHHLELASQVE